MPTDPIREALADYVEESACTCQTDKTPPAECAGCDQHKRATAALAAYDALRASHAECVDLLYKISGIGSGIPGMTNPIERYEAIESALATAAKLQKGD